MTETVTSFFFFTEIIKESSNNYRQMLELINTEIIIIYQLKKKLDINISLKVLLYSYIFG